MPVSLLLILLELFLYACRRLECEAVQLITQALLLTRLLVARLLLTRLLLTRLLLTGLHDSVPFIVAFVPNDGSDVLADSNLELLLFSTRTAAIISDVRLVKKLLLLLMLIGLLIAGIVQVIPHSKTTQLLNDAWAHRGGCTRVHQRLIQRSVVHRVVLHHGRLELLLIL